MSNSSISSGSLFAQSVFASGNAGTVARTDADDDGVIAEIRSVAELSRALAGTNRCDGLPYEPGTELLGDRPKGTLLRGLV